MGLIFLRQWSLDKKYCMVEHLLLGTAWLNKRSFWKCWGPEVWSKNYFWSVKAVSGTGCMKVLFCFIYFIFNFQGIFSYVLINTLIFVLQSPEWFLVYLVLVIVLLIWYQIVRCSPSTGLTSSQWWTNWIIFSAWQWWSYCCIPRNLWRFVERAFTK